MNKAHATIIALALGVAAVAGTFAALETTSVGARAAGPSSAAEIAARQAKLAKAEKKLKRAGKRKPPALPPLPAGRSGSASGAAAPAPAGATIAAAQPIPAGPAYHDDDDHDDDWDDDRDDDGRTGRGECRQGDDLSPHGLGEAAGRSDLGREGGAAGAHGTRRHRRAVRDRRHDDRDDDRRHRHDHGVGRDAATGQAAAGEGVESEAQGQGEGAEPATQRPADPGSVAREGQGGRRREQWQRTR
jgi:hypothetical protein